jgi:hypothetical protein
MFLGVKKVPGSVIICRDPAPDFQSTSKKNLEKPRFQLFCDSFMRIVVNYPTVGDKQKKLGKETYFLLHLESL